MSSVVAVVSALTCHHHICGERTNLLILLVSPLQNSQSSQALVQLQLHEPALPLLFSEIM